MKKIVLFMLFTIMLPRTAASPLTQSIAAAAKSASYIICLDGGGSKTEMQVLDKNGTVVQLKNKDGISDKIYAPGSNINTVGKAGIELVLKIFLNETMLASAPVTLASIAKGCVIIGGFSGAGRQDQKDCIAALIQRFGFDAKNIVVAHDAELALELAGDRGIILISGTGSICFGRNNGKNLRVGGLGRLIGDEGSGYQIGLAGLRAALEDEFEWGTPTTLKDAVKKHFNLTDELKTIISPFHKGEIAPAKIAALAPIVFSQAEAGDSRAIEIIDGIASDLGELIAKMITLGTFSPCPLYFLGGTFKNKNAEQFIKKIVQAARIEAWQTCNVSKENPTTLIAQKALGLIQGPQ